MANLQNISEIQQYYAGQTVFITGATGFLGKIVLEKLLRSCPDIKKVYVLLREKRGKSMEKRFEELFSGELFDPLKKENPNFYKKIEFISGNCEKSELGLSTLDKKLLIDNVSTVFHIAAMVKFTKPLKVVSSINVRSLTDLLDMAKDMPNLKAFVYVSTAYSHSNRSVIGEEVYDTPINGEKLLALVDLIDNDEILESITPKLLHDWNNTYVFTKAIAENVAFEKGKSLPVAIVRPAIVTCTLDDPITGWTDSVFGIIGVVFAITLGLLRCMVIDGEKRAELVPADYVTSCIISAGWDVGSGDGGKKGKETERKSSHIYNYVASPQNPITWGEFQSCLIKNRPVLPTVKSLWYPYTLYVKNRLQFQVYNFFLHTLPGYIIDFGLMVFGQKPKATEGYKKLNKFMDVISYFTLKDWQFSNDNTQNLWKKLSDEDKKIFKFDMASHSWNESIVKMGYGARVYLLKDPLETIPEARRRLFYLKIANYCAIGFGMFLLYTMCKSLISLFI